MQNKGFVKTIAVLLSLICLYYLSFSFVTKHYEDKAAQMGDTAGALYLDSLRQSEGSVWLGQDYKHCEELQIGLGLDLKGGMNVILEVSVPDVVRNLAGEAANDPKVKNVIAQSATEAQKSGENFLDVFVRNYSKAYPNQLGGLFAIRLKEEGITPTSSDAEVKAALEKEVKAAVSNSYQVVQQRIDRFGVAQPNIQILEGRGQMGQIMVEMPGIKEPERMRKLLQGSANLEFWECYSLGDVQAALTSLESRFTADGKKSLSADSSKTADASKSDTVKAASNVGAALAALSKDSQKPGSEKVDAVSNSAKSAALKKNPLFANFVQMGNPQYAIVGYALAKDTAAINKIIYSKLAHELLPSDLRLAWSVNGENGVFSLYALRGVSGKPALAGEVVADAAADFDPNTHRPVVSMKMTTEGARQWATVTKNNVNHPVAIVLDGVVYSAPNINEPITGGSSVISGNFTVQQTQDLANVLKSGKMPAPTNIVQEETVGPSLGAASINAGFLACGVAFVLLMVFMCAFYGFVPGMVANVALMLNFFFTFGVLTSFQAALTLSGLAGMVLTLGMAVDANVLIYERIKEELLAKKNIKQALADGYSNAFSAILDSNLTSVITAVILYYFGTGPIRGFAMTLGIGIVMSFFTAVWLTRIAYEAQLERNKWLNLTFTTAMSRNFLTNMKVKFMDAAKKSYVIVAIFVVAGVASLAMRGLQLGIDFSGGRNYVVEFEGKNVSPESVKEAVLAKIKPLDANATVNTLSIVTTQNPAVRISTSYKISENTQQVDQEVEKIIWSALHDAKLIKADYNTFKDRDNRAGGSIISAQKVGPSVAADMTRGAAIAVVLSLAAVFLYILFRFRSVAFSLGAIGALAIDTFLIIAMYSLCYGFLPFSLEVDQTFIGAVLTAIGYSINDKVVVFDRIRENLKLFPTREPKLLFNDSINKTLTRTTMTSFTTLLVLLCIFFLGGDAIRSFSFAMILGVVFGTLSSIFLAAPFALSIYTVRKKKSVQYLESEAAK